MPASARDFAPYACVVLGILVESSAGQALADDAASDACLTAPVEAQRLQRAGKLLDARQRFMACARNTCPGEIVQDCTRWVRDVDDALPSVVVTARDANGRDLMDVSLSIDGGQPVSMSARAISLDPGAHDFVFVRPGNPEIREHALVREGEKNRAIVATFAPPPRVVLDVPAPRRIEERPVTAATWVAGGFALAGLAVFGTFGAIGVSDRASNHCDTGCTASEKSAVDSKFDVADVGLAVGAVGLGLATWLFLARPTVERSAAFVDLHAERGGGMAVVGGRF